MRCRTLFLSVLSATLLAGATEPLAGQADLASRGPRFLWAPTDGRAPADASNAELLHRRVSITLYSGTLDEALKEIARQAHLELIYSEALVPTERRVTLQAQDITVAAALTEVLLSSGVDVVLLPTGQMGLVKKQAAAEPGVITGHVTNAETGEPVVNAQVVVEGTGRGTSADTDGRYRIANVEPGLRTVSVTSIGYARVSREIEVGDGATVTVNFALAVSPSQLDEVVVTVTGEQRMRELGHVVGRIDADSLVKEAPVSSLTELLNGRVPGLQVFTTSGTVGGHVQLQVRGASSVNLSNAPVVVVDGIRYTGVSDRGAPVGPFVAEPTTRLNDLNPNDIESIEIVKGPSAATLYGTDAANGVVVITTKRGRAGETQWNVYARASRTEIPVSDFADGYFAWGHESSDPATPIRCPLLNVAAGSCVQDRVVRVPNPLNDPQLSIFKPQPRWEYGASVAGGEERLGYYISGDYERAVGPFQLPPAFEAQLEERRGGSGIPDAQREPNAFTKANIRANLRADLAPTATLQLSAGYTQSATRTLSTLNPYNLGIAVDDPAEPYGTAYSPENIFAATSTEQLNRFTGSATAEWRPRPWLRGTARGGIDLINSVRASLIRAGDAPSSYWATGLAGDDHTRQLTSTLDVGLTASRRVGRLSSRTSVGTQYVRALNDALSSTGTDLPPGGKSVGQAASIVTSQAYQETATLGGYVEQVVGLNDRLFVTGALRADGASTFGREYEAVLYPKASASWILSEEPFLPRVSALDELRIRYAFGASGRQPEPYMGRTTFHYGRRFLEDSARVVAVVTLGNANLRPERVREHEVGLDASFWRRRVTAELTWHRRTTYDGIMSVQSPPSIGGSIYTNVGLIKGHGFEARVTAQPLDWRGLSWDLAFQHNTHDDEVIDLGDTRPIYQPGGTSLVAGYPLGARFVQTIEGFTDANGDGIIEPTEVQFGDTVYAGHSMPRRTQTLASTIGLFGRRLRLSMLLERRSGFTQIDGLALQLCSFQRCRGAVDPSTPLAEQAQTAALQVNSMYSLIGPGGFTRLREVAVTYDLGSAVAGALRARQATISLQGRNLALWSSFSGPDPESASSYGAVGTDAQNVPQARTWTLRIDLGF